jgi:glutathione S-transferase
MYLVSRRDIFTDVAAILYPIPRPEPGEEDHDGFLAMRDEAAAEQQRTAESLRISWEEGDQDPLIGALVHARQAKEEAEQQIRALLAYGREFVQPRPYTLGDLAGAAGLSISGVRTAYGHRDVDAVAGTTGAKPREWRAQDAGPARDDGEAPA